jgi:hypothetical protein
LIWFCHHLRLDCAELHVVVVQLEVIDAGAEPLRFVLGVA